MKECKGGAEEGTQNKTEKALYEEYLAGWGLFWGLLHKTSKDLLKYFLYQLPCFEVLTSINRE